MRRDQKGKERKKPTLVVCHASHQQDAALRKKRNLEGHVYQTAHLADIIQPGPLRSHQYMKTHHQYHPIRQLSYPLS
jgi:hypothetical protein